MLSTSYSMLLIDFASFLTVNKFSHKQYLQNILRPIDIIIKKFLLVILLFDPASSNSTYILAIFHELQDINLVLALTVRATYYLGA